MSYMSEFMVDSCVWYSWYQRMWYIQLDDEKVPLPVPKVPWERPKIKFGQRIHWAADCRFYDVGGPLAIETSAGPVDTLWINNERYALVSDLMNKKHFIPLKSVKNLSSNSMWGR